MLIDADNLALAIDGRPVLAGVAVHMSEGEIYGLLGPNGAGKSSTLAVLTGLRTASGGRVRVLGIDPAAEGVRLRGAIGVMPENGGFYDWMTAPAYLRWFGRLYGRRLRATDVAQLLSRVGLEPDGRKAIGRYSRGMRQRLALARALVNDPRLLLLDEPTNGLDPRGRREIHALLLSLSHERGVGILLSTHLLDDVENLCNRIGILDRGATRVEGSPAQLLATGSGALRFRVRTRPLAGRPVLPPGVQVDLRAGEWWHLRLKPGLAPDSAWRGLLALGWPIVEIRADGGGLEELYLRATEAELVQ